MGVLLLESQHKDNLKVSDFLADWQGHVPDAWGDAVALELLKVRKSTVARYLHPNRHLGPILAADANHHPHWPEASQLTWA